MSKDPRTQAVTARFTFRGVMLACINRHDQYEVGMVVCPSHKPAITISQDGAPDVCISQNPRARNCIPWPAGHDLIFNVINPTVEGVRIDPNTDQETGFHRVLDLEGFLLHRRAVTVRRAGLRGRRVAVTAGSLYTAALSRVEFDLFTWTSEKDPGTLRGHIGFIAQDVGLNVQCRNQAGSGIEIIDVETGRSLHSMPARRGISYEVLVENDCRKERKDRPELGTDFRFFYSQGLVTSSDDLKFDLGIANAKRSPDACENTFMSRTDGFGIKQLS